MRQNLPPGCALIICSVHVQVSHVQVPGELFVFVTNSNGGGPLASAPVSAFYSAYIKGDDARTPDVTESSYKRHFQFATDTVEGGVARINRLRPESPQPVPGAKDVSFQECCTFVVDGAPGVALVKSDLSKPEDGPKGERCALEAVLICGRVVRASSCVVCAVCRSWPQRFGLD